MNLLVTGKIKLLSQIVMILGIMFIWQCCTVNIYAKTDESDSGLKDKISEVISSNGEKKYDISSFGASESEVWAIWSSLVKDELYLEYAANYCPYYMVETEDGFVTKIWLGFANDHYEEDLVIIKSKWNSILSGVQEGMTDLDKVIYFNQAIKGMTVYTKKENLDHPDASKIVYNSIGILKYGKAVCEGYTDLMEMLLHHEGIESRIITSPTMNHKWNFAKVNDKWYHLDVTWNDTNNTNAYLLRTDREFLFDLPRKHSEWFVTGGSEVISDKTDFYDWYVHRVLKIMHYEGGNWYFVDNDGSKICSDNAIGTNKKTYVAGTDLSIESVGNDIVNYREGNEDHSFKISEKKDTVLPAGIDFKSILKWLLTY